MSLTKREAAALTTLLDAYLGSHYRYDEFAPNDLDDPNDAEIEQAIGVLCRGANPWWRRGGWHGWLPSAVIRALDARTGRRENVYNLWERVREHPAFRFGVVFTADDTQDVEIEDPIRLEEILTERGNELIDYRRNDRRETA